MSLLKTLNIFCISNTISLTFIIRNICTSQIIYYLCKRKSVIQLTQLKTNQNYETLLNLTNIDLYDEENNEETRKFMREEGYTDLSDNNVMGELLMITTICISKTRDNSFQKIYRLYWLRSVCRTRVVEWQTKLCIKGVQ